MEEAEFNVNSLSDEELDDVRRAMPDDVEPTAENFERGHRLANLSLDENEDAYERDGVRPVWDDEDEELEGGAFLADPGGGGEWIDDPDAGPRISRGGDRIADAIRRGYYTEEHRRSIHGESAPAFPGYDMNVEGPDYSQPDPFDTSDPEQASQAQSITDMEETIREDIERSTRPRNEG
jgi:hypothetical protein